jgi:uncharacterized glyoxalase superfamily protein PhnB
VAKKVVPMIHVPDVRATVDWYQDIGFEVIATYGDEGEGLSFAVLSFGSGEVMFSQDGEPSSARRREVDLYVYTDDVDDLYHRLKDRVEVVESPDDTFYGARELIIRDLNRFWITFAQPTDFEKLMTGVREGDADLVRAALNSGRLTTETLSVALVAASGDGRNTAIAEMLTAAGAVQPIEVGEETLQSYAGSYRSEYGRMVEIIVKDDVLLATPRGEPSMILMAVDETTFRPSAYDQVTVEFRVEDGKTVGLTLNQGPNRLDFDRE